MRLAGRRPWPPHVRSWQPPRARISSSHARRVTGHQPGGARPLLGRREAHMQRSTERILTTHTGSLPRPEDLTELLYDVAEGKPVDQAALAARVRAAVAEAVQ